MNAWLFVRKNAGSGGIDEQTIAEFENNLKSNLYKIWNRMSSGAWMPPVVRGVEIAEKQGGVRLLGIPTVADRVAQMVVKMTSEPEIEALFHKDSFAYRFGLESDSNG